MTKKNRNPLRAAAAFLGRSKKSILLVIIVAALTLLLSAALSIWLSRYDNTRIHTIATIKTIGVKVYWDKDFKNETKLIQWGTVYLGSKTNYTVYVRSTSNEEINLNLTTENWNFTQANGTSVLFANRTEYMNLTWNREGTQLKPGENVTATFTLYANASNGFIQDIMREKIKYFSFDVLIHAQELFHTNR